MKPVTLTICEAGSPSGRISRNCSRTGARESRGMTRVVAGAVVGARGGFCGPAALHPRQTRQIRDHRMGTTTLGLRNDPDNATLSSPPHPNSSYAMQDTPSAWPSQHKSSLFRYPEKFAPGRDYA